MFGARVFTPPVLNEKGLLEAGGELRLGTERVGFVVDLSHWSVPDYERQWKQGTARLLHGAPRSALMTAYRGPGEAIHLIWALWREGGFVYVQEHPVVVTELDPPFDPMDPYSHVGERIPTSVHDLPIPEWQVDLIQVYADAMGIRWPLAS
jgi:CdiI N-terminal domain